MSLRFTGARGEAVAAAYGLGLSAGFPYGRYRYMLHPGLLEIEASDRGSWSVAASFRVRQVRNEGRGLEIRTYEGPELTFPYQAEEPDAKSFRKLFQKSKERQYV